MAATVYVLCALAALTCAWLLGRSYARSRVRLLLWSSICFVGLALNNVMLFIDKVVIPHGADLSAWRLVPAAVGIGALVYGLVWETE